MPSAGAAPAADTPIQFELVHAVRGRTRLRVTPAARAGEVARDIGALLATQPGVRTIRPNESCGSVVVTYDPDVLDLDALLAPGREHEPERLAWLRPHVADGASLVAAARGAVDGWVETGRRNVGDALAPAARLLDAARDQMSAVMSFWSANSVVARSRTFLGWLSPTSGTPPPAR